MLSIKLYLYLEKITFFAQPSLDSLQLRLKQVAPGIRASEIKNISYTSYSLEKVDWKKVTYTFDNGNVKTITIPKNIEPPSLEVMYEAYGK